ncbi:hypothetical protein C0991_008592 [Blastosporella zonata]|nr:hypothetical protein C0991_008592 [Blastosporella zonata]
MDTSRADLEATDDVVSLDAEMPLYGYTANGTAYKPTRSVAGNRLLFQENPEPPLMRQYIQTDIGIRNDWITDNRFLLTNYNDFTKSMNADQACRWGMCEWDSSSGKWTKVKEPVEWDKIMVMYPDDDAIANLADILDWFCDPVTQQFSMTMVE